MSAYLVPHIGAGNNMQYVMSCIRKKSHHSETIRPGIRMRTLQEPRNMDYAICNIKRVFIHIYKHPYHFRCCQ